MKSTTKRQIIIFINTFKQVKNILLLSQLLLDTNLIICLYLCNSKNVVIIHKIFSDFPTSINPMNLYYTNDLRCIHELLCLFVYVNIIFLKDFFPRLLEKTDWHLKLISISLYLDSWNSFRKNIHSSLQFKISSFSLNHVIIVCMYNNDYFL